MKLLKLSEVESGPEDQVFRASVLEPCLGTALFVSTVIGLVAWWVYGGFPLIVLLPAGAGLTFAALITGASALKAMRSTNVSSPPSSN